MAFLQIIILSGFSIAYKNLLYFYLTIRSFTAANTIKQTELFFFVFVYFLLSISALLTGNFAYFSYFTICTLLFELLRDSRRRFITPNIIKIYCILVALTVLFGFIADWFFDVRIINLYLRSLSGSSLHFMNAKPALLPGFPEPLWLPFLIFNPLIFYFAVSYRMTLSAFVIAISCLFLAQKTAIFLIFLVLLIRYANINLFLFNTTIITCIIISPIIGLLYFSMNTFDFTIFERWNGLHIRVAQILSLFQSFSERDLTTPFWGIGSSSFFSHLQGVDLRSQEIDTLNIFKNFGLIGASAFWLWISWYIFVARKNSHFQAFVFLSLIIFSSNPGFWTIVSVLLMTDSYKWSAS